MVLTPFWIGKAYTAASSAARLWRQQGSPVQPAGQLSGCERRCCAELLVPPVCSDKSLRVALPRSCMVLPAVPPFHLAGSA